MIVLLLPSRWLDLFKENYSTLSLETKGYLYLLFLGITIGLLLGIETGILNNVGYGKIIATASILAVIVPHHLPYNLQADLHLLFAYSGFFIVTTITFINILIKHNQKILSIYCLLITLAFSIYLEYSMVNTLSEIIAMFAILLANLFLIIKLKNDM